MTAFQPPDENFRERVENSFRGQPFLQYIGATLGQIDAGEVEIHLPPSADLTQQHGYVHGGALTTIGDVAAAYAAFTLAPAGTSVLTTELKVNFLRPAGGGRLVARGRVIKPGRTLVVSQADVIEHAEDRKIHVLTGLVSIMLMPGLND